ncbi:MAG TPA: HAD family hydrolase [Candidatus Limnocylindrales bacterium]|nr:HAD family hydrolase [Candidatus Limnocylindrales bacterium]
MTSFDRASISAITFDFGNTLVPVGQAGLRAVVESTGRAVCDRLGPFDFDEYLRVWSDERDRQFREEVPEFRETDLGERFVRVLARLRGMSPPPDDVAWDQEEAARRSTADEIAWALDIYSAAFLGGLPPDPAATPLLEALAQDHSIAIVSNWPLAATIDRYVDAAGWAAFFKAIVISQRVGVIKPHPAIFEKARHQLGDPPPDAILHVGDDWAADVVGASHAGWRVAYLRKRPHDSPLPSSERDGSVVPDLEADSLAALAAILTPDVELTHAG